MIQGQQEFITASTSAIHAVGVFAKKRIPKQTNFAEYLGRRISNTEADAISESEVANGRVYLFELDEECTIDGNVPENTARFINHSCEPNAEAVIEDEKIVFVALQDIKPGDEITFDYQLDTEDPKDHPCLCGTTTCRKTLAKKW